MTNKADTAGAKMICKSIDALTKEVKRLRADIKDARGQQIEVETEVELEEWNEDEEE